MAKEDELERLSQLEEWMRARGVLRLRTDDGVELHLGPKPVVESDTHRSPQSPDERAAARAEREHRVMFASSSVRPKLRSSQ